MKCQYYPFNLKFKHPFTISKGTKTHQPTLIVELEHFGIKGYGEAPAITYYHITVEDMIRDLEEKKAMIERFAFTEPDRYWHFLHHLLPKNPFLVCALDMAAWDIWSRMSGKPLYQLLKGDPANNPLTDFTIGIDTVDQMVAKLKERPWPVYKVKVGTADDLAIVKALRAATDVPLRVDANAGWDLDTALKLIPELEALGVEYVEQPLAKDNWEGMKILYERSPLPLYADESCVFEQDVEKCVGHFHGINIKLTKCSGITPARRMIQNARRLGLKIMMGCMNESTVGSAAIAHLAPFIDHVDVDGPLLLEEDVATGLGFDYGKLIYSEAPGLGIEYKGLFKV
ncbi:dipeptide epimerase [Niabella sp.]|uniref:dipeptide epimerase n=1 Tax=Niabella sp. TaxID=1962976 RepID=UPI002632CEFE|nr:dipeptide epimerase [Niabella sp.]